jgi:hypothetical protein
MNTNFAENSLILEDSIKLVEHSFYQKQDIISEFLTCDLNQDGELDFIVSHINYLDQRFAHHDSLEIFISDLKQGYFRSQIIATSWPVHARQIKCIDLNRDGKIDILIADHGHDLDSSLSQPKYLIQEDPSRFIASKLEMPEAFYFNVDVFEADSLQRYLLITKVQSRATLEIFRFETINNRIFLIPQKIQGYDPSANLCLMTLSRIPSPEPTWILGGCDCAADRPHNPDHLLKWKEGVFQLIPLGPEQEKPERWGSAAWLSLKDSRNDGAQVNLLRLSHNRGFNKSQIDILTLNLESQKVSHRTALSQFGSESTCYFHKAEQAQQWILLELRCPYRNLPDSKCLPTETRNYLVKTKDLIRYHRGEIQQLNVYVAQELQKNPATVHQQYIFWIADDGIYRANLPQSD